MNCVEIHLLLLQRGWFRPTWLSFCSFFFFSSLLRSLARVRHCFAIFCGSLGSAVFFGSQFFSLGLESETCSLIHSCKATRSRSVTSQRLLSRCSYSAVVITVVASSLCNVNTSLLFYIHFYLFNFFPLNKQQKKEGEEIEMEVNRQ